ncbi:MAG: radical SAM protein [bacterium]|nr:radical SAM protein [bacterium]
MKENHLFSQKERVKDSGDFPKVILIDTTAYCNLRCSMCVYKQMTRKKGVMDMGLYQKLIDEIAQVDLNVRLWAVFFGDPFTIRDKLYPYLSYAKEKGLTDVVLNTNGNLMDERASLKLIEVGLDAIYIGIDAFKEETYKKLRVRGNFNRVVRNVERLIELKEKLKAKKPEVYVQYVVMEENEAEVGDFKNFWLQRGANVKIRPKVTWAGAISPWKIRDNISRYPCYWLMRSMNICWDGRVVLCAVDLDAKVVMGDISKFSIQEVWLGELKKMRELQIQARWNELPAFCRDCTDWQHAKADFCC